jgi:hypothetical protein
LLVLDDVLRIYVSLFQHQPNDRNRERCAYQDDAEIADDAHLNPLQIHATGKKTAARMIMLIALIALRTAPPLDPTGS